MDLSIVGKGALVGGARFFSVRMRAT
jgi:hypothetical protein